MPQPKSNDISEMTNHFFPDNAPLPLEIHGLDHTRAGVSGLFPGQELSVEVDEIGRVWVRAQHEKNTAYFFITPEKAAAIGNAFLRFAELARERTIGAAEGRLKQTLGMED